jgi:hypothetical protein
MRHTWSREIAFDKAAIAALPITSGVYRILQNRKYPRYRGSTRVLKIGMSRSNLRKEIRNHFGRHTVSNRLKRILGEHGLSVTVQFIAGSAETAREVESKLLQEFENAYWDVPVFNSTRGFRRGADAQW